MLTLLDRSLIWSYLKAYLVCLVSMMGLFVVVDLFTNLDKFTQASKGFVPVMQHIGLVYLNKLPQIFNHLCEAIGLLAGMFTVAWMQRNNELLPLLSAGVSTRRVVQPVLICAGAMMILASLNQELGLPHIDSFMIENRENPDGAKEVDVKGNYDRYGTLIGAEKAVMKDRLLKNFNAVIPPGPGRHGYTTLQAKVAHYIPESLDDKRSGGYLLEETR